MKKAPINKQIKINKISCILIVVNKKLMSVAAVLANANNAIKITNTMLIIIYTCFFILQNPFIPQFN